MDKSELSKQAQNSLELYRGNNPDSIKTLLNAQRKSIVDELKKYFNANDLGELAVKLSIGK